ncbi:NADAR family protein [Dyella terrae]|uniref:NADAR family protein n=2 Tax=Dyella TaxID=231454 RepID=A0A4R0YJZ6_9GAMM|nr:NADAR family protein [Dyella terrae]TCI06260.1 NADAR family protein [Dyella soli]
MTPRTETPQNFRMYVRAEVVVVHKTRETFGGLSNMAPGFPIRINGVRIATSEALYQACRFPHLPNVQREIIEQHSPMTAKMKSKSHREDSREDWDQVRTKIMRWCLRVKLSQNFEEFSRLLLSTKDRSIVEQSSKDDYWGAKLMGVAHETLIGRNILGRLLMELREEIKNDAVGARQAVSPPNIPNFLFLGEKVVLQKEDRDSEDLAVRQTDLL